MEPEQVLPKLNAAEAKRAVFHLFNPAAHEREEVVEILLWEWYGDTEANPSKGCRDNTN